MLTSPSRAACSAAHRAGLVSWMISAGLRWINHISRALVLVLSVRCLTMNLPLQSGDNSHSPPSRTPMTQGWEAKEATTKQKQMGRKSRMTEQTFMAGNRRIAHSFCNEN